MKSVLIPGLFKGESATVLLYGQSGIGKEELFSGDGTNLPNIVEWCSAKIFSEIPEGYEAVVSVAMVENYCDTLVDVINRDTSVVAPPVKIREAATQTDGGTEQHLFCENLAWTICSSHQELVEEFRKGLKNVTIGYYNSSASARDLIVTIALDFRDPGTGCDATKNPISARFTVACLKGSERVSKTLATGRSLLEAKSIGLSLSALGNCIQAMHKSSTSTQKIHIPFRDSKLTRYLQCSFIFERLMLVGVVSAFRYAKDESVSTIRFISRFQSIDCTKTGFGVKHGQYGRGELLLETLERDIPDKTEGEPDARMVSLKNDPCRRVIMANRFHRGCIVVGTKKTQL